MRGGDAINYNFTQPWYFRWKDKGDINKWISRKTKKNSFADAKSHDSKFRRKNCVFPVKSVVKHGGSCKAWRQM